MPMKQACGLGRVEGYHSPADLPSVQEPKAQEEAGVEAEAPAPVQARDQYRTTTSTGISHIILVS